MKQKPINRDGMSDRDYIIAMLESMNGKFDMLRDDMIREHASLKASIKENSEDIDSIKGRVNWMYAVTAGAYGILLGGVMLLNQLGIKIGIQ